MQRFDFPLQTALRVRLQTEKRLKEEYLDQHRRLHEEQCRLRQFQAEQSQAEQADRERRQNGLNLSLEIAYQDYGVVIEQKIDLSRENIVRLQTELKRRQQVWIQARKEVKVLEKLRERRLLEYRKEANRQEQKFYDEVSLVKHQAGQDI